MQVPSDDAQPDDCPTHALTSTTPQDIDIRAQAESFSTQNVTGQGDIHYAQHFHTGYAWVRSDEITPNQVAEAQGDFVCPPGYETAWDTLTAQNALVISAAPNTGKRTTAMNLLAELRYPRPERQNTAPAHPDLGFRKLAKDWETPLVSKLPLFPDQALLLDLSDSADQAPSKEFGKQLVDYAGKLKEIRSFLIVLVTTEVWASCVESARSLTVDDLKLPIAKEVIEKRLQSPMSRCPERVTWLGQDPFDKVSSHDLLPRDAVALYQAITAAENSPGGRDKAIDQFHGWREHLTGWWKDESSERGPYERAMQIVTASIGQAPAADVLTLTDRFLETAGHETDVHLPLAGPDLSERLRRTGVASTEGDLLKLEPIRPRFSGAALDHVWRERPQVQGPYKRWIAQVTKEQVGKKYVEQIAASVTGMGIRRKSVEFLELIDIWVKENTGQDVLAARMLEDTCLDPVVGAKVRERLRSWTENKTTPDQLINIVIAVCRGQLGYQRTVVALVRLKKIVLRFNADLFTDRVGAAIVSIARYPDRLQVVLSEVIEWMEEAESAPGRVGFLALMKPGEQSLVAQLLDECRHNNELQHSLTAAWHTLVYANPGDDEVVGSIRTLLAFANTQPELIDITANILGPAIQGDLKRAIAGKVLFNAPVDEANDSGGTVHAKLLDLLFDESPHAVPLVPVAPDSAGGEIPIIPEIIDDPPTKDAGDFGAPNIVDEPAEIDTSPAVTPQYETGEVHKENEERAEMGTVAESYRTSGSFDAFEPDVSPDTPTAAPSDDDSDEKRRFGRFWR